MYIDKIAKEIIDKIKLMYIKINFLLYFSCSLKITSPPTPPMIEFIMEGIVNARNKISVFVDTPIKYANKSCFIKL